MPIRNSVGATAINATEDVRTVQQLLNRWRATQSLPPISVDGITGPETLGAIRLFQERVTRIVDGRLDPNGPGIRALEGVPSGPSAGEIGLAIVNMLDLLDQHVQRFGGRLPERVGNNINSIRRRSLALAPPNVAPVSFAFSPPVASALVASRPVVFAAVPIVVGGVALTAAEIALLAAISVLIAVLIMSALSPEFRDKASELKAEIIKAATDAIFESIVGVEALRAAVEQCRRINPNPSPACLQALTEFNVKVLEISAVRTQLTAVIQRLGSKVDTVFNISDLALARTLLADLFRLRAELNVIVARIIRDCGCSFIRI